MYCLSNFNIIAIVNLEWMANCHAAIEQIGFKVTDFKPSDVKTIILWGADSLLTWYLNNLLDVREDWQVTRITSEVQGDFPFCELERLRPDVVLICGPHDRHCLLPAKLLEAYPKLKVLTINLENNFVEINDCEKIEIDELSDFLSILED